MTQQQTTGVLDPTARWADLTVVQDGVALHEDAPAGDDATLYPRNIRAALADTGTILGATLFEGIMAAQRDLRQAQVELAEKIGVRVAAKQAEDLAKAKHTEKVILATAALYEAGLTGANEKARQADLEARLVYDGAVSGATWQLAHATAARIVAEGEERIADAAHKALRAELTALGQLVAAS